MTMLMMRLIWLITMISVFVIAALADGEQYSHSFNTFHMNFSTPHGVDARVYWSSERYISVNLNTGENLFVWPKDLNVLSQDLREKSDQNLKILWINNDLETNSDPTIIRLNSGDYIVFGYKNSSRIITCVMRTFDFDGDDILDYCVLWNGYGVIDHKKICYLANTTRLLRVD